MKRLRAAKPNRSPVTGVGEQLPERRVSVLPLFDESLQAAYSSPVSRRFCGLFSVFR